MASNKTKASLANKKSQRRRRLTRPTVNNPVYRPVFQNILRLYSDESASLHKAEPAAPPQDLITTNTQVVPPPLPPPLLRLRPPNPPPKPVPPKPVPLKPVPPPPVPPPPRFKAPTPPKKGKSGEKWTLANYQPAIDGNDDIWFTDDSSTSWNTDDTHDSSPRRCLYLPVDRGWRGSSDSDSSSSHEDRLEWWIFETRRNPYSFYRDLPSELRTGLAKERRRIKVQHEKSR